MFEFFEEPPNCFPQYHFTLPPIINKTPISSNPYQHVLFFIFLKNLSINHVNGCEMVPHCGFNLPLSDG